MARPAVAPSRYRTLALTALFLVTVIIVSGASVRLSKSGLGCDDWPNCSKTDFIQISNANQAIEQINRLFTGLVSFGVIAAVLGALWRVPKRKDLVWLAWGLVFGVLAQIVIGGISVLLELDWWSVMIHFLASIALTGTGLVLYRRASEPPGPYRALVEPRVRTAARVLLGWFLWVLVAGTLVTAAGPHGGDEKAKRLGVAIPTIARVHGVSVMIFLAGVLAFAAIARKANAPRSAFLTVEVVLLAGIAQAAIGYIQYFTNIPAVLVGFHVAGSVVVFCAMVWLQFTLREPVGVEAGAVVPPASAPSAQPVLP